MEGANDQNKGAAEEKMGNGGVRTERQKSEYPLPYFHKDKNIYANTYKVHKQVEPGNAAGFHKCSSSTYL